MQPYAQLLTSKEDGYTLVVSRVALVEPSATA